MGQRTRFAMPPDSVLVSGGDFRDEPTRRETFADTADSAPLRLAVTGKTGSVSRAQGAARITDWVLVSISALSPDEIVGHPHAVGDAAQRARRLTVQIGGGFGLCGEGLARQMVQGAVVQAWPSAQPPVPISGAGSADRKAELPWPYGIRVGPAGPVLGISSEVIRRRW